MKRWRRLLIIAGALVAVVIVAVGALLGTAPGTRLLWRAAAPYLPAELSIAGLEGSVLRGVELRGVRWSGDAAVSVDQITIQVRLLPLLSRHVSIVTLHLSGMDIEGGDTDTETSAAPTPLEFDIPLVIDLHDVQVRDAAIRWGEFVQRVDTIDIAGRIARSNVVLGTLRVVGDGVALDAAGEGDIVAGLPLALNAEWRWVSPDEVEYSGALELDGDADEYQIEHELSAPYAVTTSGRVIDALAAWRVELNNQWTELDVVVAERVLSSSAGSLEIDGNTDRFELDGSLDVQTGEYSGDVQFLATGNSNGMSIERFAVDSATGMLAARGSVDWTSGVTWRVEGDATSIDVSQLAATLDGVVDVRGIVASGSIDDRRPARVDAEIEAIDGTLGDRPIAGDAVLALVDRRLEQVSLNLASEQSRLSISGSAGETLDLAAEFDIDDLTQIAPDAKGSLAGAARIAGALDDPSIDLRASGVDVAWRDIAADTVALQLDGRQSTHALTVDVGAGAAQLSASTDGGLIDDEWRGSLTNLSIATSGWGTWVLDGAPAVILAAEHLSVAPLCLNAQESTGSACVEISRTEPEVYDLKATTHGVPLAALPFTPPQGVVLEGVLEMSANARIENGVANGNLDLSVAGGSATASYDGESLSTRFERADATLNVVDNRFTAASAIVLGERLGRIDADLQMADVTATDAALSGEISANVDDLALVSMFVPDIRDPQGALRGTLQIAGTRSAPRFGGTVRLTDGAFRIPRAGIELNAVALELRQMSGGRFAVNGGARSGDGAVELRGEAQLAGDNDAPSWIDIDGSNVQILRLPDQQIVASPDVRLSLEQGELSVSGQIDVPAATLTLDTLPPSAQRSSPDAVVHGAESDTSVQRPIRIDVRASLGEAVRVSGFGLSTRVEGALRVSGERDAQLLGVGRLDLRDGEYEAYGQTLDIERGELIFNGPLDRPQLNIRASRKAGDVTAGVDLTGTPDQLRSVVFSEPALSDAEALSYLLTGRPLRSASSTEGNTLNQAAFALGLSRAGAVTEQIRSTLGLETLAVEGGSDSGRIVAGKQLGGRLFLEYGYGLVDQLGTLLLRYQLSDRLILETSSGSATALDLVYSVKKD